MASCVPAPIAGPFTDATSGTGASSGLGRRIAVELARRGATVVGIARRQELLDELAGELGAHAAASRTVVCDVSDADAYQDVLADVEMTEGKIDVLIAAAGIEAETPVPGATLEDFRKTMDVNFFGVVVGTLAVVPGMVARRHGIVVNVSSDSARAPASPRGSPHKKPPSPPGEPPASTDSAEIG